MEEKIVKIFYGGFLKGGYPKEGQNLKKTGLPLEKLGGDLPYLWGEGRKETGRVRIFYSLLPEYSRKSLFTGKPKGWKREAAQALVAGARQRAAREGDCREEILVPELADGFEGLPPELLAVGLFQCRPFDRLAISLSQEAGQEEGELARELLCPYLARMRQVVFVGKESRASRRLEEYLSYEFGIIMISAQKAPGDMPWLDLDGMAKRSPRARNHINQAGMLKFLDTAVKNGYNTDVNSLKKHS